MFEVWESRAKEYRLCKWTVVKARPDGAVTIAGRYPTEDEADRRASALNRKKG